MDRMTEGELWSWVRRVMCQGAAIRQDHEHKTYEEYSARLDAAAAERAEELTARLERRALLRSIPAHPDAPAAPEHRATESPHVLPVLYLGKEPQALYRTPRPKRRV